jgi:hypothetical protein
MDGEEYYELIDEFMAAVKLRCVAHNFSVENKR